ncbi:MAG: hypothetical protein ABSG28_10605 [Methanoregula sp.]|jgi:hypothetical protein
MQELLQVAMTNIPVDPVPLNATGLGSHPGGRSGSSRFTQEL